LGILFLKPAGEIFVESQYFRLVSGIFNLMAVTLFIIAFSALRPSLRVSPIPKPGAPLIVIGIYRWFRHPMYIAVLLIGLGMLINNFNFLSTITYLGLFVNMIIKSEYEDRLLRGLHDDALEYQKMTLGLLGKRHA
jgi:protein-S-isoprenylcysteine O-methyltransferase Ste14